MSMLPDKNIKCPATGFAKSCREIVIDCTCPKFVQIRGTSPQGGEVDQWGCVDSFIPMLLIENSQQSRQAGAAVESMRNELVRAAELSRKTQIAIARHQGGPLTINMED